MKILVIGGTGKVGTALVDILAGKHADLRVLTRSAERAALLPKAAEPVVAGLVEGPAQCGFVFDAVDTVFMLNRTGPEELAEGLLAVQLAREAGVKRFVYQSAFNVEELGFLPHLAPKLAIQRALVKSEMEWTFLLPNNFFQNDLTAKKDLESGVYPLPVGRVGCSSIDVRDIAEAAAITLTSAGHGRQSYNIVGPEALTGESCAAVWSNVLGRPVRHVDDVSIWQQRVAPFMPAWLNYDLGLMYRHIGRQGYRSGPADVERLTTLLGRPPRRYETYVREQAGAWGL